MIDMKYKNVVIVTGAAAGIGLAVAQKYLKEGFEVIGLDINRNDTVGFPIINCDISEEKKIDQAFLKIEELCESIKYLINCAGVFYKNERHEIKDMDLQEWNDIFQTNLTSIMHITKKALPYMKKADQDKAIVNISSDQAYYPRTKNSAYAVSKGGMVCFSKACAVEFLKYGIRVNVVSPASVKTNFIRNLAGDFEKMEAIYEKENDKMPLGIIAPEDVAESVYYFGSKLSRKITGQEMLINSGLYL